MAQRADHRELNEITAITSSDRIKVARVTGDGAWMDESITLEEFVNSIITHLGL